MARYEIACYFTRKDVYVVDAATLDAAWERVKDYRSILQPDGTLFPDLTIADTEVYVDEDGARGWEIDAEYGVISEEVDLD